MIRPLRVAHRRFFVVAGVCLLPILLISGFSARRLQPVPPPATQKPTSRRYTELMTWFDRAGLHVEVAQGTPDPDLLAYWSAQKPADALPSDAVLLGSVAPGNQSVFDRERAKGYVVVYSLGHHKVVSYATLEGAR